MKYKSLLLFCLLVAIVSCKEEMTQPVSEFPNENPFPVGECSGFTDFPDIPGWSHEEITIPDSYNRSWKPYFINEDNGFLYGSGSEILRTSDMGDTWEEVLKRSELSYEDMYFPNENEGFLSAQDRSAGGDTLIGGALLKTLDGGTTWIKYGYSPQGVLRNIMFLDENNGFASFSQTHLNSGSPSTNYLARTEDGGATWTRIFGVTPASTIFNSLQIYDSGFGYFGGKFGVVYLTHDAGATWERVESGFDGFYRVQFLDEMNGFVYDFRNFGKTTDGGETWTITSELLYDFFHFFTPTEGISLQTVGVYDYGDYWDKCNAFSLTSDGGETWEHGEASFNFRLGETFFVNENLGFSSKGFNPGVFVRLTRD